MNVPRNAKIKMDPKLRKKVSFVLLGFNISTLNVATNLFKLISGVKDYRRK